MLYPWKRLPQLTGKHVGLHMFALKAESVLCMQYIEKVDINIKQKDYQQNIVPESCQCLISKTTATCAV